MSTRPDVDPSMWVELGRAESVPPNWVVSNVLLAGLTVVGGPPKAMKSTITMALACVCAGVPCDALPVWMSRPRFKGRVLILSAEATAGELRYMAEKEMGVTIPDDGSILIAEDAWEWQLDGAVNENGLTLGHEKLLAQLNLIKPVLTILDPYRDFTEADENDSGQVVRTLRPIRNWHHNNHASFIVAHHTGKKPYDARGSAHVAEDLRGSSGLLGKADGVLMLTPRGKNGDPNPVEVNAKFKRGKSWNRTVQVKAYGWKDAASEVLTLADEKVLDILSIGVPSVKALQKQAAMPTAVLDESLSKLLRNGWIVKKSGIPVLSSMRKRPVEVDANE